MVKGFYTSLFQSHHASGYKMSLRRVLKEVRAFFIDFGNIYLNLTPACKALCSIGQCSLLLGS